MQTLRAIKRPIPHYFRIVENDETVATTEGPVLVRRGDVILTGTEGEVWPVQANKFLATYDILSNNHCQKRPIEVLAVCLERPFQIAVYQDSLLEGKPGDWLVQYEEANYGIVAQAVFEKNYDILGPASEQINIGLPKIRIENQLPTPLAMFDHLQNCLLGKDAAILRFHPRSTFAVGWIIQYQPLDEGHPPEIWYQARITRIRENGYVELEPIINHYVAPDNSAFA